ncbi:MAG: aspartate aminotransferase family protein [Cyclobacteriaceae bacterium]|nr:aspartate aminotransferase family protein [Cyclobacteriaceae bacterium]
MTSTEFRKAAHELVDWMADYMDNVGDYPVKPNIKPGDIKVQLPTSAPEQGEGFQSIFSDFNNIILPGITHWQHPQFAAYFPSGTSGPSVLAEMLSSAIGAQCMIWLTSPSAEELEERMMEWLRDMLGLPKEFTGVIQDSSSSSTLVALLTAREALNNYSINKNGFEGRGKFRIYTSEQAHSSVDKGVKIAGFGIENLVKIAVDENFALKAEALEAAINKDLDAGYIPLCVVSTIGTTSSTAVDPIRSIGEICKKYKCWHHIDASYSGAALLIPSMRWMSDGVELADSFVFNPHKWMLTNFDCSAYYVKDKKALINTFSILPEYLKTPHDHLVNNYRDWSIPLGRRFRALKLWFVIRSYGVEGLRKIIEEHIGIGQWLKKEIEGEEDFEILAPVPVNLICFRYRPIEITDEDVLNNLNTTLLEGLNQTGKILLTQTKLDNKYTLRYVSGNSNTSLEEVKKSWDMIIDFARKIKI